MEDEKIGDYSILDKTKETKQPNAVCDPGLGLVWSFLRWEMLHVD